MRLLVGTLLLPPLLWAIDALARAAPPPASRSGRGCVWTLAGGAPVPAGVRCSRVLLAAVGLISAAPPARRCPARRLDSAAARSPRCGDRAGLRARLAGRARPRCCTRPARRGVRRARARRPGRGRRARRSSTVRRRRDLGRQPLRGGAPRARRAPVAVGADARPALAAAGRRWRWCSLALFPLVAACCGRRAARSASTSRTAVWFWTLLVAGGHVPARSWVLWSLFWGCAVGRRAGGDPQRAGPQRRGPRGDHRPRPGQLRRARARWAAPIGAAQPMSGDGRGVRDPPRAPPPVLRGLSTVLIVAGVLVLADAAATLLWQEPVTALQTKRPPARPAPTTCKRLEAHGPDGARAARAGRAATTSSGGSRSSRARCSGAPRPATRSAACEIPRARRGLRRGQGHRPRGPAQGPGDLSTSTPLPGVRRDDRDRRAPHDLPGAVPAHRRAASRGDRITVEMPYATFTYRVAAHADRRADDDQVLRASATTGWCSPPATRCSAPPSGSSLSRG